MTDENKLLIQIKEVCSHPKRYTRKGTFKEVAAFIEKNGRTAITGTYYYHSIFTPFLKWFVMKTGKDMTMNMENFQKSFSSENEALKNFPALYKEYIQSLETVS